MRREISVPGVVHQVSPTGNSLPERYPARRTDDDGEATFATGCQLLTARGKSRHGIRPVLRETFTTDC